MHFRRSLALLCSLAVLAPLLSASAAPTPPPPPAPYTTSDLELWVDTIGNDRNECLTRAQPCRTGAGALSKVPHDVRHAITFHDLTATAVFDFAPFALDASLAGAIGHAPSMVVVNKGGRVLSYKPMAPITVNYSDVPVVVDTPKANFAGDNSTVFLVGSLPDAGLALADGGVGQLYEDFRVNGLGQAIAWGFAVADPSTDTTATGAACEVIWGGNVFQQHDCQPGGPIPGFDFYSEQQACYPFTDGGCLPDTSPFFALDWHDRQTDGGLVARYREGVQAGPGGTKVVWQVQVINGGAWETEAATVYERRGLITCAAAVEGAIQNDVLAGGTNTAHATRLCACTSDGAASPAYKWKNMLTGTLGNATTCPD